MHTTCFPPDHIAVSLHPGRAYAEGLDDIDGMRDAPVGISKWSQANLQYALHEAVRTGVKARGAGLFTDVDFSTTGGRATLPKASAVNTPSAAAKLFDNSKARSPLFADTVSSMLAFIRAAVASCPVAILIWLSCHGSASEGCQGCRRKVGCRKEAARLKGSVRVRSNSFVVHSTYHWSPMRLSVQ